MLPFTEISEPTVIDRIVAVLCREFDADAAHVRHLAATFFAEFAGARVQMFVPVLVERRLRDVLRSDRRLRNGHVPRQM